MKILMIHKVPPFNRGGAEQVVWQTAKRLADAGHEIVFFSPKSILHRPPPDVSGVRFEWVPTSETRLWSQLEFFLRGSLYYPNVFQTVAPDIVYDNICPFPFHLAHVYGDTNVVSKVHAVHRMDAIACKQNWIVKLGTIIGEETFRLFANELFITNSESTSQRLSSLISTSRNEVVTNPIGIDPEEFTFNLNEQSDIVLALAKLNPRKNVETLLRAWQAVETDYPEARLVIAGSGSQEAHLHSLCDELGLSKVEFRGFVSDEEKHNLLERALIYVLPTLYEGFGISNLEAMASGCAVISTDTWGVKDYLQDGENGLMVGKKNPKELSDAILRVLNDRTLAGQLARGGYVTANQYTMDAHLRREVQTLEEQFSSRCR